MKFILPVLFAFVLLSLYFWLPAQDQPTPDMNEIAQPSTAIIEPTPDEQLSTAVIKEAQPNPAAIEESETNTVKQETPDIDAETESPEPNENETENKLTLDLEQSTHFLILGNAASEQGQMNFKSELLPSNEVKLAIDLQRQDKDNIELKAYFDLANFTMELDGGNSVLTKEDKKLLKETGEALQSKIWEQYADYDIPEHALMLAQMLAYWSVSPEGFVHEKRVIVSQ